MKVVIIDDELHCINVLILQLQKIDSTIEVVRTFTSPLDALKVFHNLSFDILFIDIQMPNINGFDFLSKINPINFTIVFTTAYSQYAIEAFKYSAFDYLLKPISKDQLASCLERWKTSIFNKSSNQQINYLSQLIKASNKPNKLTISTHSGHFIIHINDIKYCMSDSNYTNFHIVNNKIITASKTLKEYEQLLFAHDFIRIHKSYLLNLKYIINIHKKDGYTVELTDGSFIPVSRNKHILLKNKLTM